MKKLALSLAAVAVSASLASTSAVAEGAFSANVGLVSEYVFRGIQQTDSATASAGVDYENGGFYAGVWTADVEDGLEIDYYAGYGVEFDSGFGVSLGVTRYDYTGNFDTRYDEINLGLSFDVFSISYNVGEWEDGLGPGMDADYTFVSFTVEQDGFYGTFGSFSEDADGNYYEVGYGTTIGEFDAGVAIIKSDEDLNSASGQGDSTIVFSLSKSF